jgi:uncharacterized protein (DUF305 family)
VTATATDDNRFVPSRPQWTVMVVALLFLAASIGYVFGTMRSRDASPGPDSVDVGFLQDMITHHEQALSMSNLELIHGAERGVQVFAREILQQQSYEIGQMDLQLERWRYSRQGRPSTAMAWMGAAVPIADMPGLASDDEMRLLGERSGRDADALFVPLMQDHHRGGIHMAEYAAEHASTKFVREIAARMAKAQRLEISEMDRAQTNLGLVEQPEGYVPATVPSAGIEGEHSGH